MRHSPIPPAALLCFIALTACADREGPVAPQSAHAPTRQAPRLATRASDPRLRTLVVELGGIAPTKGLVLGELTTSTTGAPPLLYNIQLADGYSESSLRLPAGASGRVVVRAHDDAGALTHQGEGYLGQVLEGEKNAPLSLALTPVGEGPEATVTIGVVGEARREVTVAVSAEKLRLAVGERATLRAEVLDREGRPIPLGLDDIRWALSSPREGLLLTGAELSYTTLEALRGGEVRFCAEYHGTCGWLRLTIDDSWVDIAAGGYHGCALRAGGAAYCWGSNVWGQIGTGAPGSPSCGLYNDCQLAPRPVADGLAFRSIDVGMVHSCGVTDGGDAYCWGNGDLGQMGNGTTTKYNWSPVAVSAGGLKFTTIDAGGARTCALTDAGDAYCWGDGVGLTPVLVARGVGSASPSAAFACVTTLSQKLPPRARCVGRNSSGQLGDLTTTDRTSFVSVAGDTQLVSVSAGDEFACALYPVPVGSAHAIYCWGANGWGQLGNDGSRWNSWCGTDALNEPYCAGPELVSGKTFYKQLSAGGNHACAVTAADDIHCWGGDVAGQLGEGPGSCGLNSIRRPHCKAPVTVAGGLKWSRVSAGDTHSCAITLDRRSIYCWGAGDKGQLGDGTLHELDHAHAPVQVATPL